MTKAMTGLIGLLLTLTPAGLGADGVTFTPEVSEVTLNPGDTATVQLRACIPGGTFYDAIDIYLLADNTGSMGPIIFDVKAEANELMTFIGSSLLHPNLRVGVGQYWDFPLDAEAFVHTLTPALSTTEIGDAIATWQSTGGNDGSEGQFYALTRLASDEGIGFRPGAKRFIFWFGDAPGHDPICAEISGEATDITEASTIAALNAAGPGGTIVLATSISSGAFPAGLNADPEPQTTDYDEFCIIGGTPGQGDRVAAGTDGASLSIEDPALTAETLADTFALALRQVRVSLDVSDSIAGFVTAIDPPFADVQIPLDPEQEVCVDFTLTLEAETCIENTQEVLGTVTALFDGALAEGSEARIGVLQPACETQCLLFLGLQDTAYPVNQGHPGPADLLSVVPLLMLPVTLDDIPVIPVPDNPELMGLHVYTQVYMHNPVDFPADPLKLSNGLDIELGGPVLPYGAASGMQHWSEAAIPGGVIDVGFSIDAFSGD